MLRFDRFDALTFDCYGTLIDWESGLLAALRPVLDEKDPALAKTLDEKFAAVESSLGKHRRGDGWRLHNELSQTELKELTDVINALAEPISKVAAIVAGK